MNLPWRREDEESDTAGVPKEVQDYYQAEKRERVGIATLLAIGTLIATILIASGIFFGGRYIWRHTLHHNKASTTAVATSAPRTTSKSSTLNPGSAHNTKASATAGAGAGAVSSPKTTATSPGPVASATTNSAIPDTGPSNIVPYVLAAAAVSFVTAEWYQKRSLKR